VEKARITRKTLLGVYENAFDLYQRGEFEDDRDDRFELAEDLR